VAITASPIRVEAVNLVAAMVLAKGAVLSGVVPRAADLARVKAAEAKVGRADKVVKAEMGRTAVKVAKFIMDSPLL